MLSYLADYSEHFGPLRLLRSTTFRTIFAALTSLIIGFAIGPLLIAKFKELKFGHAPARSARATSTRSTRPRWAG
jgi:phospho-N-acetylmuramoyl-pentapeptide-transferase